MEKSAKDFISSLCGEPVLNVGRASDMAWFSFGEKIKDLDSYGKEVIKSSLALHLQCPWRMIDKRHEQVLFGSYDMYEPNTSTVWTKEFDWDIQGINLFDEKAKIWINANNDLHITSINYLAFGDLKVTFSNNSFLEVLINTSAAVECWRFLHYKKRHLIQKGCGIEFV
jgi:hypothetical protein